MINLQLSNNSPLVSWFKQGKESPSPFQNVKLIAKGDHQQAIPVGDEIFRKKAILSNWLGRRFSRARIKSRQNLSRNGFCVERLVWQPPHRSTKAMQGRENQTACIGPF